MSLPKIMIIDDSEMMRKFLQLNCLKIGDPVAYESAEEALENLTLDNLPDIILLDLNLPSINGQELLTRLSRMGLVNKIPVLVLSGDTKIDTKIECLQLGAADYLTKPFHPKELNLRINSLLKQANPVV